MTITFECVAKRHDGDVARLYIEAQVHGLEVGPYPRILDTVVDYAAVGSVAARRAS